MSDSDSHSDSGHSHDHAHAHDHDHSDDSHDSDSSRKPAKRPPPPASSYGTLACLPREIFERIIKLACRLPEKGATNFSQRSPLALDMATTRNLAVVSRPISYIARFLPWYNPRITKPSALFEMYRELRRHCCIGLLMRNLHIGGEEEILPNTEWPLVIEDEEDEVELEYPSLSLKTSFGYKEEERLPRWCRPDHSWSLEPGKLNCEDAAVSRVIHVALEKLDVEPYRRCSGKSGLWIGLERWATRLFELQAIVDLCLEEMRRVEDREEYTTPRWRTKAAGPVQAPPVCRLGKCSHYPRLVLSGWDVQTVDGNIIEVEAPEAATTDHVVTRAQVWKHLTRRGSALDKFDHPILFARSTFASAPICNHGRRIVGNFLAGPHKDHFSCDQFDPEPHEHDHEQMASIDDDRLYEERVIDALQLCRLNTVPKLMITAVDVLSCADRLVNLSLTGTLDMSLFMKVDAWSNLKSLCLGPLLPVWNEGLEIGERGADFEKLENLRICGALINEENAEQIAGNVEGKFPNLKRVQWEMVQSIDPTTIPETREGSVEAIFDIVTRLQGRNRDSLQEHAKHQDGDSETPASKSQSRLIEVRLHPSHCKSILERATPRQRTAWRNGEHPPSEHHGGAPATTSNRIRLTESKAAKMTRIAGARKLQTNSREWWEECAAHEAKDDEIEVKGEDWMPNAGGGVALMEDRKKKKKGSLLGGVLGEVGSFEFGFRSALRLDEGGA